MHVCNAAVKDSTPLITQSPPPRDAVAALREKGRKARLYGAVSDDPVTALLAQFPVALGRRLVFFEPSSCELSFDEAWLLNLFDAVQCHDHDRYCFAMRSRMSKDHAADLHFSVMKAADALEIL